MRAIGNVEKTGGRRRFVSRCLLPSAFCLLRKDSRHQSNVRQMRAARKWIIERYYIARANLNFTERRRDCHRHRAQMHGHVIALRDYTAGRVEDRA